MDVWILTKEQNFDAYGNVRLMEEAKRRGVSLRMVCPEEFDIIIQHDHGDRQLLLDKRNIRQFPSCIIPRMGSSTTYFALAVIRELEQRDVFVLNSSSSIELAKDKLATVQMLASHTIPIPKTMLAKLPIDIDLIRKEFSFPLLIKKISGSQGKGIFFCKSESDLEDVIEMIDVSVPLIIQECIMPSLGKDIRAFVIGGKVIGAMQRTAPRGSLKANASRGGSVQPMLLSPEIEWLATEASRIVDLEIAGVDLLFDEQGYRVCEVNSSPGFEGFEKATGLDVARAMMDFIHIRLGETV